MTTEPTAKYQQEARELVTAHAEHSVVVRSEQLIDTFASALSSRDTEIREVLEGLITHVLDEGSGPVLHWCPVSEDAESECTPACLAARGLWERVQGTVNEEESDVAK